MSLSYVTCRILQLGNRQPRSVLDRSLHSGLAFTYYSRNVLRSIRTPFPILLTERSHSDKGSVASTQ
ncbi:hypothetical protein BOTBODRAFT_27704 [Botryobasidium botryosum FD-172 SS1]|uniref:Uncharacterized protein n=1 Tax=Botryobasidium botryosum (strain FD-172 SS1) TaxID=930990 RepID=A0A067MX28_BOTB1|nr:hypothetical protein BOTBODRAFT_27704 [Botryobasidium botryosum FD-172 SS1]